MKEYVFSIILCAFSCWILTQIISDTKKKDQIRLLCGIILAISILLPLSSLNPEALLSIPALDLNSAEHYITEGEQTASEAQKTYIKSACEAYFLEKAKTLGSSVAIQIILDEDLIPVFAEIYGDTDDDVQLQLQNILTTDLGIPKENQKWIWNQENNSS